jgi:FkbM family methyltransferase
MLIVLHARRLLRGAYAASYAAAAAIARRLIPPESALGRLKGRIARKLKPLPRHPFGELLETFAALRPNAFFIQVGSNDGAHSDPLRPVILNSNWRGILIEPVPYVFERLRANYGHIQRLKLENVAIAAQDGTLPFHHLRKAAADDAGKLPGWYDQLGSFLPEVVLKHKEFIPDIEQRMVRTQVQAITFDTLCRRHGVQQVDLIHIDTEGYDYEIIKLIDWSRLRPKVLLFEHHHLAPVARAECETFLRGLGYDLKPEWLDTWCLQSAGDSAEDRALRRIWNKLPAGAQPPSSTA